MVDGGVRREEGKEGFYSYQPTAIYPQKPLVSLLVLVFSAAVTHW